MKELIQTINEIVKYGLVPDLSIADKEKMLERQLVKIYDLSFDITYEFDNNQYSDYDNLQIANIRKNVETNFKDFGFYKTILEVENLDQLTVDAIGDAIDDLTDIIKDLLEIKWRIENNSLADGLWYFDLIFRRHTLQHILDLLNYMKHTKE